MSILLPLRTTLRRFAVGVEDALLAQDCFLCRCASGGRFLCGACGAAMPRLTSSGCPVCALPTLHGETCGSCLRRQPHFDATVARYAYAFPVDRLVQALKYRHELAVAAWLGARLAEGYSPEADLIVVPPLHPVRLRQRGFNQALEIARAAARQWRIPIDPEAVERIADGPPQASLPWRSRRNNMRGAFLCHADVGGRRVLAIDDVMTTGSTLDELAKVLKARGAARVTNCIVARTLPA